MPADSPRNIRSAAGSAFLCLLLGLAAATAQPSGGPYGPLRKSYELPAGAGRIFYVAADGAAERPGATPAAPTTLEKAIEQARTGDAIIMRGGTYRTGNLKLNQGITIQPYQAEQPILKGTLVAAKWDSAGGGVWAASWTHFFPSKPADWWRRDVDGRKTPLWRFNNDMVFVDGRFLQAVGWLGDVNADTYYIDYEAGRVYIGLNPANRLVEITAYDVALLRTTGTCYGRQSDHRGYTLRGLTFTQYAYRALEVEGTEPEGISNEASHGKDVVGTTLEDCTISYCSRVAGYFRGDRLTLRRCRVSDTSTEGIYIIASNDVLLEQNVFTRNNIEEITGYYPAAVKIFNQCYRVTCRDNLVIDLPNSNGIWYDVGNVDGVFVNNWVQGVGRIDRPPATDQLWPSDNGFFFEISKGAVCAGNVFVNCDHGVMVLNSSNVQIWQNTFVNSIACLGRNGRVPAGDRFGWHSSTGPGVEERDGHVFADNLLSGDRTFDRPLLFVWQPPALCERLNKPLLRQLDANVYVRVSERPTTPLILWSPAPGARCQAALTWLDGLRKLHPEFAARSREFQGYNGPLFKSAELGDFRLLPSFPASESALPMPSAVQTALGLSGSQKPYIGAYAP